MKTTKSHMLNIGRTTSRTIGQIKDNYRTIMKTTKSHMLNIGRTTSRTIGQIKDNYRTIIGQS